MNSAQARFSLLVGSILVACGLCGGSSFILIRSLVGHLTPLQLVAGQVSLAALVLGAASIGTKRLPPVDPPLLRQLGILAVIDTIVPYTLIALAASHVLASTSALLISTMPIFTAVFVSVVDRSRLSAMALVGVALGALGVGVIAGPSAADLHGGDSLAMLAVVLAAASLASAAVYARGPLRKTNPIGLSACKFALAAVVVIPAVAYYDGVGGFQDLSRAGWLSLLGIGVMSTAIARCGYVWVISVAGSVTASLLTYIVPAAALVLGFVFLGETVSWSKGLGLIVVAASLTCVLFGELIIRAIARARAPLARRYELEAVQAGTAEGAEARSQASA